MDLQSTRQAALIESDQIDGLFDVAGVDGVKDILAAFWRSTDKLSVDLADCVSNGACVEAGRTAHALKGSAANVGASRLADAARTIETCVKNGDLPAAKHALERLAVVYKETREALERLVDARA